PSPSNRERSSDSIGPSGSSASPIHDGPGKGLFILFVFMAPGFVSHSSVAPLSRYEESGQYLVCLQPIAASYGRYLLASLGDRSTFAGFIPSLAGSGSSGGGFVLFTYLRR